MKIICNNCLSGFFLKNNNCAYDTPFVWNRIHLLDFCKLLYCFDSIDFNNFVVRKNDTIQNFKQLVGQAHAKQCHVLLER